MTPMSASPIPADFDAIVRRIHEKMKSYERYNFSACHNDWLKAFFDLAQEYDQLADFYRICVAVPLIMADISCDLYVRRQRDGALELVCSRNMGVLGNPEPAAWPVRISEIAYIEGDLFIAPVFSRHLIREGALFLGEPEVDPSGLSSHLLGMLVARHNETLDENNRFFLSKYAGRIGYSLDNHLVARQNVERLEFINTLVMDIEHNVIVPNMYFRHLFGRLKKRLARLRDLEERMERCAGEPGAGCGQLALELRAVGEEMRADYQEIVKHHAHMTLFIESLFRREHFEQGHLVLRPRRCLVEKEIIIPQLEHYAARLAAAGISVDRPWNMYGEEIPLMVDFGLLAQVYANLFSNAAKYTREIVDHQGQRRKAVAYGRELVADFPRPGHSGIKFNVFTTGPTMNVEEGNRLFLEGARGENDGNLPGSGHGLSFIRHVVEIHGGKVGYEATGEGNNFYFILPLPYEGKKLKGNYPGHCS